MTHTYTITEKKSTGNGDLDGFKVECSCGYVSTNTFEVNANFDAREHVLFMEEKEKRTTKKSKRKQS